MCKCGISSCNARNTFKEINALEYDEYADLKKVHFAVQLNVSLLFSFHKQTKVFPTN